MVMPHVVHKNMWACVSGHVVEDLRCNLPLLQWLVSNGADGTRAFAHDGRPVSRCEFTNWRG